MDLAARAALTVGSGYWSTAADPRAIITDGPHGVRLSPPDEVGIDNALPATCFPPAAGLASSWNTELVERVGRAIGAEAAVLGVDVVLGPGVNIKRSPLCGRNFEYYSEDPLISGELGGAWVKGLQSTGVGASLKHFAANNQETRRMTVSAEVDERTLRELYLPAFERIVQREQPRTVMCAYNRLNGIPAAEHHWLLTDVLRSEWRFEGAVISDWGAVDARVPALLAGVDLEMPGPQADSVTAIVDAIEDGTVAVGVLDAAVARVLALKSQPRPAEPVEEDAHHELAREAARQSIVLLKNDGRQLPLGTGDGSVAVIGELARTPRIQGAGSSKVATTRIDVPLDSLDQAIAGGVEFAPGYTLDDDPASALRLAEEATRLAATSGTVLLFVGLPEGAESEGYDRTNLRLPPAQERLIERVSAVNARTVVILSNGGVVTLEPWHDSVPAILETWLLGQGAGAAIADVVLGRVSPSGRLAETIPRRLEDTASFLNFPGEHDVVRYGEGVFVGYRYTETTGIAARYPFGHGLGYSAFDYTDLKVSKRANIVHVRVTVRNSGTRDAAEVVQLYVAPPSGTIKRPRRELRAFTRAELAAGDRTTVEFDLGDRDFSIWDDGWVVPGGEYLVEIGRSAADIVLAAPVAKPAPKVRPLTMESTVAEFLAHPVTGPILARGARSSGAEDAFALVTTMPMRRLLRYPGLEASQRQLRSLIRVANNPLVRGVAGLFRRDR